MTAQKHAPVQPGARVILDTAEGFNGENADTSRIGMFVDWVQVANLPAATSVQLQVRVHDDAAWLDFGTPLTETDNDKPALVPEIQRPFPQLRAVRTGAGDVKIFIAHNPRPGI